MVNSTIMTSREFNQNSSKALKLAESGPVYITNRGRMAQVLLSHEAYVKLQEGRRTLFDAVMDTPADAADVDLESYLPPRRVDTPEPLVTDEPSVL